MKLKGISIQQPYAHLIVTGKKVIETRTYPIPERLVGKKLALIETSGASRKFKARVIGIVEFNTSWKYNTLAEFRKDEGKHLVSEGSAFDYDSKKGKWAWPIKEVTALDKAKVLRKRCGIVYTNDISI